ncbi:hypothetical protein [Halomarina ordinaria]|uniref:Glycine zipper family protein n=1 Tax=Halomarina ordinaria TaxID=3033939 RepID=A0ABD5U533_9EURY|nr:hypothetical protein [Halomarina sp. PSRA2]
MDYKDLVVVALTFLVGNVGATYGAAGAVAGIVVGAGVGAKWASESDRVRSLERRVEELER